MFSFGTMQSVLSEIITYPSPYFLIYQPFKAHGFLCVPPLLTLKKSGIFFRINCDYYPLLPTPFILGNGTQFVSCDLGTEFVNVIAANCCFDGVKKSMSACKYRNIEIHVLLQQLFVF